LWGRILPEKDVWAGVLRRSDEAATIGRFLYAVGPGLEHLSLSLRDGTNYTDSMAFIFAIHLFHS
jgi:hypothetical protein